MRNYILALLLASISTQVLAQQQPHGPPPPKMIAPETEHESEEPQVEIPPPMPLQVHPPSQQMQPYDRIMYVLDVSGSMTGILAEAIRVTGVFASDSFKVAVVTFNDDHQRWAGVEVKCKHKEKEPHTKLCLEKGWAWMPTHNEQLVSHLGSFSGNGSTDPTSALDHAYKNVPENTLIVFISDGEFSHEDGETDEGEKIAGPLSAVRAAKAWRRNRKLAPVQMLVWAPSEADSKRESLVELAKLGGGGLWRPDTRTSGPW
jgi:hypothetical protein